MKALKEKKKAEKQAEKAAKAAAKPTTPHERYPPELAGGPTPTKAKAKADNTSILTMTTWLCPACTLYDEAPRKLNTAPFSKGRDCQGTDHLNGKKHSRAMNHVGDSLLLPATLNAFFDYVHEFPKPDLNRITPMEALMEYTAQCGGDAEKTASHFIKHVTLHVAPDPGRRKIKAVVRDIASKAYARTSMPGNDGWIRLLCCWDDPTTNSKCQRGSCPYLHVSDLLASHPGMTTEELFSIIPCTFAGTKGGCWWHSKWLRSAQLWNVPEFELAENEEESRPLEGVTVDDDNEHILVNYNGETLLRRRGAERRPAVDQYGIDMRMSVRRWLQGYDDDEED